MTTFIKLRFVEQQKGVFTKLIGVAQYGSELSHVDGVTDDKTYIGAHLLGGVQEFKPGYDAGFRRELFVRLKATEAQADAFVAFLRSHLHEPYDPIAVTYFWGPFANRNWHEPGAWECTQFIATGLLACKWLPENKEIPVGRITPAMLYWLTSTLEAMANGGADV